MYGCKQSMSSDREQQKTNAMSVPVSIQLGDMMDICLLSCACSVANKGVGVS